MTSSPDALPPALPSMWRALKLGYRHEPWLMAVAFALALLAALPDALLALWLKLLGEGVLRPDRRLLLFSALGLGLSAVATWFLTTVSARVQRRFRDKVTVALESHVARLQASVATIAHQERPDYLDRLSVLRDQVFVLDHMYMSLFSTCGWILRLVVVIGLLTSIHPALALLAVFALPTVLTSAWRPAVERASEERGAQSARLARHLFTTATTAAAGKEVRVTRIGERLARERRAAWERWYGPVSAARRGSAAWHTLAWAVFGGAYVGAIVFVASGARPSPGDVLLVLAAGARLSAYIGATVGEIGFLRGIWLDGSRRLAWLEDYAASLRAAADQPAPTRLTEGIRLEGVSFAYPGTDRLVLLTNERETLSQKNIALQELLHQFGESKQILGTHIQSNIDKIVLPNLDRLPAKLDSQGKHFLSVARTSLDDIVSPFISRLDSMNRKLTQREIELCDLIRRGHGTKEIAEFRGTSVFTVMKQRKIIRQKLGITGTDVNLASFLAEVVPMTTNSVPISGLGSVRMRES